VRRKRYVGGLAGLDADDDDAPAAKDHNKETQKQPFPGTYKQEVDILVLV